MARPARNCTVLVVDDNALNAKLLRLALEAQGYTVQVADSGAVASQLVHSSPPHVVLLDVQLPETDGLTLLRNWRADPVLPSFPVVIVSAFAATDDLDRAYAAGAEAFMPKPVNVRDLMRIVAQLTHQSSRDETGRSE